MAGAGTMSAQGSGRMMLIIREKARAHGGATGKSRENRRTGAGAGYFIPRLCAQITGNTADRA